MRGEAGRVWIDQLPATLGEYADRWTLTVHPPYDNLSYNYVLPVTRADGTPAVLKIGFPTDHEFTYELHALAAIGGRGMVCLLESDPERRAMLLELAEPGVPLRRSPLATPADDEAATRIAATVMRQIWRPAADPERFPSTADWGQGFARMRAHFDGGSGPIPPRIAHRAERLFAELLQSQAPPVLLHGDLHHDNILSAQRAPWLAIDPKGVTGEPAYEPGAFLRNPGELFARPDARSKTIRRLGIFAEMLGIPRDRILDWAVAQAVLSAWWMIEDNAPDLELALTQAELFAGITPREL